MAAHPPVPGFQDIDLRLLRVFHAVARCRGLSAAQGELGVTQSTISSQLSQLEDRLGFRLCERGRGGFTLTDEGRRILEASRNLFRSIENYRSAVATTRGELAGDLYFGTVDAMWSNDELQLERAFADFVEAAPKVTVHTDIAAPQDLVQGLAEDRYHLILTPTQHLLPRFRAAALFRERQGLYCGRGHPLFDLPEADIGIAGIADYAYAARAYMVDWLGPFQTPLRRMAVTSHMESIALLILSGRYIGYLPTHFAARWEARGEMRRLLAEAASYDDRFYLVYRKRETYRAVKILFDCIRRAAAQGSQRED
ncbi:MAG: LysR family transcriptional regulator [Rhodospirillales bacterium]|nr:LysR family transcriptional regulator [Rhodospirillales bacterium]